MLPIEGELTDRVRADYLAQNATRETSRAIIEDIARRESITTAKVRNILTYGPGYVRWTKEDRVWSDKDGAIKAAFDGFSNKPNDPSFLGARRKLLSTISDDLFFTQKALTEFAKKEGFWPWHGSEKSQFDELRAAQEKEENARIAQNEISRKALLSLQNPEVPPSQTSQSYKSKSSPMGYIIAGIMAMIVFSVVIYNSGSNSQSTGSGVAVQSSASSDISADSSISTSRTATKSERDAYSADLYDKPSSMTSDQKDRYEGMSEEGKEYVDEKMAEYDRVCARSGNC